MFSRSHTIPACLALLNRARPVAGTARATFDCSWLSASAPRPAGSHRALATHSLPSSNTRKDLFAQQILQQTGQPDVPLDSPANRFPIGGRRASQIVSAVPRHKVGGRRRNGSGVRGGEGWPASRSRPTCTSRNAREKGTGDRCSPIELR